MSIPALKNSPSKAFSFQKRSFVNTPEMHVPSIDSLRVQPLQSASSHFNLSEGYELQPVSSVTSKSADEPATLPGRIDYEYYPPLHRTQHFRILPPLLIPTAPPCETSIMSTVSIPKSPLDLPPPNYSTIQKIPVKNNCCTIL